MKSSQMTIRVFVSSTFRDMHAERDHLSRLVFPELRSRCLKRGVEFVGLDLRWGVTEEEAKREGALSICLLEIERCRPFFVCLLGGRFGWVPPPEEVPRGLFEKVRAEGRMPPDIAECYGLDETSAPAVYRLRRRHDPGLDDGQADRLSRFWEEMGLPLAGESITAREIMRGVFEEGFPSTHALFYLRETALSDDPHFPRELVPVFLERDPDRRRKLAALKRRIQAQRQHMVVRQYAARYAGLSVNPALVPGALNERDREVLVKGLVEPKELSLLSDAARELLARHGTVAMTGMDVFGKQVLEDLWAAIEDELVKPAEYIDNHQRERAFHERFIADRTRLFLGRDDLVEQIIAYVENAADQKPLVVTGVSGCGKSALLAQCVSECRVRHERHLAIPHFIGASPGSTMLAMTLHSICETLRRECGLSEDVPADPDKLRREWRGLLEKAGCRRPVVLVMDAINQLDPLDRSHELGWFPFELPPGVKVIASAIDGDCLEWLRRRLPSDHVVSVPPLNEEHRRVLVRRHLEARRKKLREDEADSRRDQLARLLDREKRPDAGLPLYLLVALEELSLFGSYEALDERIERLPPTLSELFDQVLARLEQDHGRGTTESICRWLAVSRSGLLESEILDLLGGGVDFPRARWTNFYRSLEFYLRPVEETTGAGFLDFYHDQLRFAAFRRYLIMATPDAPPTDAFRNAHRDLAIYFRAIAIEKDGECPKWRTDRPRGLGELLHHQTKGEQWERVDSTLTDLGFLEAMVGAGKVYQLANEFTKAIRALPGDISGRPRLCLLEEALRRDLHFIAEHPPTLFQCLWNSCWWFDCAEAGHHYRPECEDSLRASLSKSSKTKLCDLLEKWRTSKAASSPGFVWVRSLRPPLTRLGSAQRAVLSGHQKSVTCLAYSNDKPWLASGSEDRTVRIWDTESGEEVERFHDEDGCIQMVAFSPDSRWIASGSSRNIRVWDIQAGSGLAQLHLPDSLRGIAFLKDGLHLVALSDDEILRTWEVETGRQVACIRIPGSAFNKVAFSSENSCAACADKKAGIRICDLKDGTERACFRGHEDGAEFVGIAFSKDGSLVASASLDRTLRVWDSSNAHEVVCLREPGRWMERCEWWTSLVFSPDQRHLALGTRSVAKRGRVCLWDIIGRSQIEVFEHSGDATSVRFSPNGKQIAMSSSDATVRILSVESPSRHIELLDHESEVISLAFSSDGDRAISTAYDESLRIWDASSGRQIGCLCGDNEVMGDVKQTVVANYLACAYSPMLVRCSAFSPDGKNIAFGSDYGRIRIVDTATGRETLDPIKLDHAVVSIAFSPDGQWLVSGSSDMTARMWSIRDGSELHCFKGHPGGISKVAFTDDGRRVMSTSSDGTLMTWDAIGGALLSVLREDGSPETKLPEEGDARFRAVRRSTVTAFECAAISEAIGWFPEPLSCAKSDATGRTWAATTGKHIHLLKIEGGPE